MNRIDRAVVLTLAIFLLAASACGAPDRAPGTDAPSSAPDDAAPAAGDTMMDEMMAHVGHMGGMGADSMQTMLPAHRQRVGNMLAQMGADMRSMNMTTDASWNALVDSVRADVIRMPELSDVELQALMPDHIGRVTRLLESHGAMMGRMRM